MSYGLTGDMSVAPGTLFEISWFINSSDATYYEYGYFDYLDNFKLTTNYIHLGIVQEMNYGESFRPYGLFSMGTTIFSSKEYYDVWRFSLGIGGGLKYYFSDTFGLKFQGTFLLPVYFNGGGIYCGTGGCGYGIYSGTAVAQGDVKLGLVIVLQ